MLPPAGDAAWEALVEGSFAKRKVDCIGSGEEPDAGLMRAAKELLAKLTNKLPLFPPQPYTIDAETKILEPVLVPLAAVLSPVVSGLQPSLLLKDR
jgi:hypothetical protein